jgi:hypothetical protein
MKAPLWVRRNFWRELNEIDAQLIQLIEKTEKLAQEARLAMAELPALRRDFDASLARRIPVWQSCLRQLFLDLFVDLEAEAKAGSSSALEKEA